MDIIDESIISMGRLMRKGGGAGSRGGPILPVRWAQQAKFIHRTKFCAAVRLGLLLEIRMRRVCLAQKNIRKYTNRYPL